MTSRRDPQAGDRLADAARRAAEREREGEDNPEPSLGARLGQIGILGWTIVLPAIVGLFLGRWLDHRFHSGIFWTAPLMLVGLAFGCWSAWKWMRRS